MIVKIKITGLPPGLLTHNIDGGFVDSPQKQELTRLNSMNSKAKNEPANLARAKYLEWHLGLYTHEVNGKVYPWMPTKCLRAVIHAGSKLTRDGQRWNRGARVCPHDQIPVVFEHGPAPGLTSEELWEKTDYRYETVVRVQQSKVSRMRPLFKQWSCSFGVEFNEEFVNPSDLKSWIETAGNSVGLCEWRPEKSGEFGRFELTSFTDEQDNPI